MRTTISRFEPFRTNSLQEQISRLFNEAFERSSDESSITTWAPAVDIYETEHELVVKAIARIDDAQKANDFDMGGHAQKAKDLLTQAEGELKQAAEAANDKK